MFRLNIYCTVLLLLCTQIYYSLLQSFGLPITEEEKIMQILSQHSALHHNPPCNPYPKGDISMKLRKYFFENVPTQ